VKSYKKLHLWDTMAQSGSER